VFLIQISSFSQTVAAVRHLGRLPDSLHQQTSLALKTKQGMAKVSTRYKSTVLYLQTSGKQMFVEGLHNFEIL